MQAFILAGGLGTRLRSIVDDQPKPMADIEDKPFLAHQIEQLKAQGVRHVILCVGYLHDLVMSYFGNGEAWGVQIDYSIETSPLGTGGALKHAEHFVNDTFLVLNGDSFFDIDLQELMRFHQARKKEDEDCIGTLALTTVPDASRYGSVLLNGKGRIVTFTEKSAEREASSGLINAGVYVLEPNILASIPVAEKVSIERTVFPSFMRNGSRLYGYEGQEFFVDIGTPEGYYRFCDYVKDRSLEGQL
jgi:NDP-sugar pyrophosphorylase family protein